MEQYICKIANLDEMRLKWQSEIERNADDPNWSIWRDEALQNAQMGAWLPYYGILNGEIIAEATAVPNVLYMQNGKAISAEGTAYLFAFRTVEARQGMGWFGKLLRYMLSDLKARGIRHAVVGVEPSEIRNMQMYFHFGFTEYVGYGQDTYPDGQTIEVLYYRKPL